jgi:hypothetical protein
VTGSGGGSGGAGVHRSEAHQAAVDPKGFARHSVHSGGSTRSTAAAPARATLICIRDVSGHRVRQVLAGYVREEQASRDHAGEKFL